MQGKTLPYRKGRPLGRRPSTT